MSHLAGEPNWVGIVFALAIIAFILAWKNDPE